MEEIILFLLEMFGEFALGMFFEAMTEVGGHKVKKGRQKRYDAKVTEARKSGKAEVKQLKPMSNFSALVVYSGMGLLMGWLSLMVSPKSFIQNATAKFLYLLMAPLIAGMMMSMIGRVRNKLGEEPIRLDRFIYGFLFALAYTGLRFALAQ